MERLQINNPVGFLKSNLHNLGKYLGHLQEFDHIQSQIIKQEAAVATQEELRATRRRLKINMIQEDSGDLIQESIDGVKRVSNIVQGLKDFSRLDQAEDQSVDINDCLDETLNMIGNKLQSKAEVIKDYGNLPPIDCFPQQLNQVFQNLLLNAAFAIKERGLITIKTWQDKEDVLISIADDGVGISTEDQQRLFDPFFTTKEAGEGTGLGLSITSDIIQKHNGEIRVESEVGKGTTFTIILPAQKRA